MRAVAPAAPGSGKAGGNSVVDIAALLDASPVRSGHVLVTALLFLIVTIDGYDLNVTAQILPAIAKSFGVTTASLTSAYAAQPIGQAIGGLLLSPLADRFGRKPVLVTLLLIFSIVTLLSVFANSATQFTAARFFTGIAAGGLQPAAASLVADIASTRRRSGMAGIVLAGLGVGLVSASALTALLLNHIGWQGMYVIGALAPLFLILPILLVMPESPLHLARASAAPGEIVKALRKLNIHLPANTRFSEPVRRKGRGFTIIEIFSERRAAFTLVLWIVCICGQINIGLLGLGAAFFHEFDGISLARYAALASLAGVAAIVAGLSTGFVMDRFGHYRVTALYALLNAISLMGLSLFPFGSGPFVTAIVCAFFFSAASYQTLNIVSLVSYPAELRSTAGGWKGSVSRLGSSAAPLIGGALLAHHMGLTATLGTAAGTALLVFISTPLLAALERYMHATTVPTER